MNRPTSKIFSRNSLRQRVTQWRCDGETIILANGCFDLLHVGHVRYLRGAKALGGKLVVALNSDSSVQKLKGEGRPFMPAEERAEILAALTDVDAVVVFDEPDVRALIGEIQPEVQAKGPDYTRENVPERAEVLATVGGSKSWETPRTTPQPRSSSNCAENKNEEQPSDTNRKR